MRNKHVRGIIEGTTGKLCFYEYLFKKQRVAKFDESCNVLKFSTNGRQFQVADAQTFNICRSLSGNVCRCMYHLPQQAKH